MQQPNVPLTRVTLDSSTAIKLTMGSQMTKERGLMARNDAWHRIKIIRGAMYDKEVVLRSILLAVEPADLIPVRYQVNGEDAYFMARNCGPALEMLCRSNLIINLANGDPIVIIVTLAFASIHELKINIQPILLAALTRRYDPNKKYLRLDDFHRDEEIAKTVYCPLSQSKTLGHTLKLARMALDPFEHLNLQNNQLLDTSGMENCNLTSLRSLDLRNNYLMAMDALAPLKSLTITELWLDGNPLCENYAVPTRYVESARLYCPHLTKLDGITLNAPTLPLSYNNYFKASDTRKLIHQFLEHYYDIYDHQDRSMLRDLYHKNAMFSLTVGLSPGINIARQNLGPFIAENRNFLHSSDYTKGFELLYRGPHEITGVLKRLPPSVHNRRNFKVDVMFDDRERILFNVEGVFDTPGSQLLTFSRTFYLVGREDNEYNIVNDQNHVNVAAVAHSPATFHNNPPVEKKEGTGAERNREKINSSFTPREKEQLIFTLMDATTMNTEWCHRFLDDAKWDARQAIKKFMENYKSSSIPAEAFGR